MRHEVALAYSSGKGDGIEHIGARLHGFMSFMDSDRNPKTTVFLGYHFVVYCLTHYSIERKGHVMEVPKNPMESDVYVCQGGGGGLHEDQLHTVASPLWDLAVQN